MASESHKFQAPRGTRDFYPAEMAVRRHIESIWRDVSTLHGFEEIDGPTFEHLELYTAKSGEGIVNELFSFTRQGGETAYALRPEFTPTLARMYAQRAAQMPKPVKWFCVPSFFRAERPQRGRLREFFQWNADIIGDDSPRADAEVVALTIGILEKMGFTSDDVVVKINDRTFAQTALAELGITDDQLESALAIIDASPKLSEGDIQKKCLAAGLQEHLVPCYLDTLRKRIEAHQESGASAEEQDRLFRVLGELEQCGVGDWCEVDPGIVRGLAYYTGTVFEVHARTGRERALAGGGRYDKLIELFGGPPTPAVGIAMGDVVIKLMLEDRGLLKEAEAYLPRPDVFVISSLKDDGAAMHGLVAELRRAGLHARHSYKATKNIGKLLGDAGKVRARSAVILGAEYEQGMVVLKDLETKDQAEVPVVELVDAVRTLVCAHSGQE